MNVDLIQKYDRLQKIIRSMEKVLVAFSGGVDSTFVLKVSRMVLGEKAWALTAVSESLSSSDKESAIQTAYEFGVPHLLIPSQEMDNPNYSSNPINRCYFCKTELYRLCREKASQLGISFIIDGFNKEDESDYRPGFKAKNENGIRSPLLEAGLCKDEIRHLSRMLGLATSDKPASPCLASRVPYGIKINGDVLGKIERLEEWLREKGFREFRVRYHENIVRLELVPTDFEKIIADDLRKTWISECKKEGFEFVTMDIEGFRSGRLNEAHGLHHKGYFDNGLKKESISVR